MSMADLLAKNEYQTKSATRGQEIEGEVISIQKQDIILDLGTKSEGVLQKKDLTPEQAANLKIGDKLLTFVLQSENESGQVILGLQKALSKSGPLTGNWRKFQEAQEKNQVVKGMGIELNKGGLIVEVSGIRGFLPSSQVALSQVSNLDELVGKNLDVTIIEVDPNQNRLIFSQKSVISEDTKQNLSKLKVGDKVKGKVAAVLQFGIFVSLPDKVEGLVHVSEISWEKTEDPSTLYKVGDEVEAKVLSVDSQSGRVNLSIKQLAEDPFSKIAAHFQPDDVIKGTVTKVTTNGVFVELEDPEGGVVEGPGLSVVEGPGLSVVEGLIQNTKLDSDTTYEIGQKITCLVDSVDKNKRRINLAPFVTSTKDLIYK